MLRVFEKFWLPLLLVLISSTTAFAAPGITDLSSGTPTVNSIPLSWSVGSGGPATAYELRYSTAPVDAGNFAAAVPLGGVPAPTGGAESQTVSGLACGTPYYFAVKALDATGGSTLSNVVKVSTSTCTPSFADAGNYALPGSPHASATGDFNNDGKPDLAFGIFSNTGSNYVSVMLGNGGGTFQSAVNYGTGNVAGTYFLATGDFNGDGSLDLVAANWLAGNISIFTGTGDGTFLGALNYTVSLGASSVATGDFNGDGKLDLAVTIQDQSQIKIFPGNGDGTFGSAATYPTDHPMMITARDFNRDGKLDLAVTNRENGTVSILLGNGDGTFQDAASFGAGVEPLGMVAQDINGDGKLDLLVSSGEVDGSVSILLGNGDGAFQSSTTHQGGDSTSRYLALSDMNGDGIADLIDSGSGVYVSVGNGNGTFKPAVIFSAGTVPIRTVLIGDFNDDGKADMATANYGGSNSSILLNNSTWGPAGNFIPPANYSSGYHPNYVTTGDINGDGIQDVVTTSQFGRNFFSVRLGNSDGTLGAEAQQGGGLEPHMPLLADFNNDSKPDLAIAELEGDRVSIRPGNGDGTFQSPLNGASVGRGPVSLVAGDFNSDGNLDLGVGHWFSNWFAILISNGDGTFQPAVLHEIGAKSFHPVAADFNGDGRVDIVTGNYELNSLSLFTGAGDGTFTHSRINLPGNGVPYLGDFNKDGNPDLAVSSNANGGSTLVLLGNGNGTFQSPLVNTVGRGNMAVGDLDRDGNSDIVFGDYANTSAALLRGNGDGSFTGPERFETAVGTGDIAIADFNRDGLPDIITSNVDSDSISILLNTAPLPTVPQQGLVALWRAENNSLDSIGGNHGTPQGGATYAAGKYGQAFTLDGVDDYVEIPDTPSLNPSSAITVEAWYRPVSFAGNGNNAIVSKGNSSHVPPYYEYHLGVNGDQYISPNSRPGSFSFAVSPGNNYVYVETAANLWVPGNWYHLVGTYDGTEIRLYVNGVLQASAPATGTLNDYGMSVRIGAFNNISSSIDFTPGLIDEVAIHNRALQAMEIAAISAMVPNAFSFTPQTGMPLSTSIISNPITVTGISNAASISITACTGPPCEYKINGGSWSTGADNVNNGDTVILRQTSSASYSTPTTATLTIGGESGDFSITTAAAGDPNASGLVSWWRGEGNGYDSVGGNPAILLGNPLFQTGVAGQSFSFDGASQYAQVAAPLNLPVGGAPRSVSLWFKTPRNLSSSTESALFQYGSASTGNMFGLITSANAPGRLYFYGHSADLAGSTVIQQDTWYHATVIYDGSSLSLYLNGRLENSAATSLNTVLDGNGITIGYRGPSSMWQGAIDEVKIFNRALTVAEVSKLAGTYPVPFSFTPVTGATRSANVESLESITVSGISQTAPISITGGEYEIDDSGNWLSTSSTVAPGASVKVRLTTSANFNTPTTATLTIGGVSGTFTVTTKADMEKPVVTGFSLAGSESTDMTVGVTLFTATDNDTVSGYLVTTSSTPPSTADAGWSGSTPATVTLPQAGTNTLYAWAKDPAGNVSDPLLAPVLVTLKPVRRGTSGYTYYDSLSSACGEAVSGETVSALAVTVPGNVTLTGGKTLTIKGGYPDGYSTQAGYTAIQGILTVGTGTLTVDRVVVK